MGGFQTHCDSEQVHQDPVPEPVTHPGATGPQNPVLQPSFWPWELKACSEHFSLALQSEPASERLELCLRAHNAFLEPEIECSAPIASQLNTVWHIKCETSFHDGSSSEDFSSSLCLNKRRTRPSLATQISLCHLTFHPGRACQVSLTPPL